MYFLLFYDYVENVVDRRQPFRDAHLGLVQACVDRGEVILGGAYADPVDGAAIAFRVADRSEVEAFVERDPYVRNGLVTNWRIREWSVVIGTALAGQTRGA
jgi:uncharacterized protein YciI